ncbi:716_t:CDS:2, partial [Dentiscutata erythropus]
DFISFQVLATPITKDNNLTHNPSSTYTNLKTRQDVESGISIYIQIPEDTEGYFSLGDKMCAQTNSVYSFLVFENYNYGDECGLGDYLETDQNLKPDPSQADWRVPNTAFYKPDIGDHRNIMVQIPEGDYKCLLFYSMYPDFKLSVEENHHVIDIFDSNRYFSIGNLISDECQGDLLSTPYLEQGFYIRENWW